MVLMQVASVVSENEIGIDALLEVLEKVFDIGSHVGEEAVAKRSDLDRLGAGVAQESARAGLGLLLPYSRGAEHHPMENGVRIQRHQPQHRTAAANLDVVSVSTQAENLADGRKNGI